MTRSATAAIAALALALVVLASCSSNAKSSSGTTLAGLFTIEAGSCAAGSPSGSYFEMVQSGGTVSTGPFVSNPDSTCTNQAITPLSPGSDGGLRAGSYQPEPATPFAAKGNSAAASVIEPQAFFAVSFGVSTNPTDPQTGHHVPAPTVTEAGDQLHADLSAWSVSWNGQQFNQGAPKPAAVGSAATGTYDATSGAYTLQWTSLIKGGPFNGFTGIWHLVGTVQHS